MVQDDDSSSSLERLGMPIPRNLRRPCIKIEDAITRLNVLSASIRRSGTRNRNEKASKFTEVDNFHVNRTREFKRITQARLEHLFEKADPWLVERVAEAVAQGRNRIAYQRRHQKKLAAYYTGDFIEDDVASEQERDQQQTDNEEQAHTHAHDDGQTILSRTSATKFGGESEMSREKSELSSIFSGTTQFDDLPRPKLDHGDVFECPYCCILCDNDEAIGPRWL